MKLAVLDQSPIVEGGTAAGANRETLELARHCGGLGYHRYWLAEHHNAVGLAGTAPEILIGRVASLTRHMRIGPGGVMLNHYSALEVAESFRMLETLHPGRIDLGLGRAPGSARPPPPPRPRPHGHGPRHRRLPRPRRRPAGLPVEIQNSRPPNWPVEQ